MLSRKELLQAIDECENAQFESLQNCQKLATLYILYDHIYGEPNERYFNEETVIKEELDVYGDSDFLQLVSGRDPGEVFKILDELMDAISVLFPKLYDNVLTKLKD